MTPAVAVREISAALTSLEPGILLFLTGIRRLRVSGLQVSSAVIARRTDGHSAVSRHVTLSAGRGRPDEDWIIWHRQLKSLGHRDEPASGSRSPSAPRPCPANCASPVPPRPR